MRRVVITGVGAISPFGLGAAALWRGQVEKRSAVSKLSLFDPSGFPSQIAGSVPAFKTTDYVPKSYRKAVKIMARDIELAVVAADFAVRDARLATRGIVESTGGGERNGLSPVNPVRLGCNIGAGVINSDLDELTAAIAKACDENGVFSLGRWGKSDDAAKASGMDNLTPLWLLKYLPNMLACHVSIIHDAQGPSNTITCGQASAGLALAEATRTIQRNHADVALVGGCESKIHPSWITRWTLLGRLNATANDHPEAAVRPLDRDAAGTAVAEGGAVLVIEERQHALQRGATIYAEIVGLGASANGAGCDAVSGNAEALGVAMKKSLKDAGLMPEQITLLFPPSVGIAGPDWRDAEAITRTFGVGNSLYTIPTRGGIGDCAAGAQALDLVSAALALRHQVIPPAVNCPNPIHGLNVPQSPISGQTIEAAMVAASAIGGQNSAVILKKHA